jgi:hypothetical protein
VTKAIYFSDKIPGTRDIVAAVMAESNPQPELGAAWRPVRSGALKAMTLMSLDRQGAVIFMHPYQFSKWLEDNGLFNRKGGKERLAAELGMGRRRRDSILAGATPTRVEALACAHYGLRLMLPFPPGNASMFRGFVQTHFGRPVDLAKVLDLDIRRLRSLTEPGIDLIRAVDWVRRVGPYSPFGETVNAGHL